MKLKIASTFLISLLLSFSASAKDVDDVLKIARAQLGSDDVLDGVKTLQYFGRTVDADDKELGKLELRFKKANKQRLDVLHPDGKKQVTVCNDYEGHIRGADENGKSLGLNVLSFQQVKLLQLNAHENLSFLHGPRTKAGGKAILKQDTTVDGVKAHHVVFEYSEVPLYERYFDAKTGKLLKTVSTAKGVAFVEKEAIIVDGIRFPKEIHNYKDGELIRKVIFDKIVVNEPIDDALFEFPEAF